MEPLPTAWVKARAVFLPKSRSADIEAHRPAVPSEPLLGWASWSMLIHQEDAMQPIWLAAEGFVKKGRADAHILTAPLLVEKTAEWGEQVWYLRVDLADASGTIQYPDI